jgi:hypothetical protein
MEWILKDLLIMKTVYVPKKIGIAILDILVLQMVHVFQQMGNQLITNLHSNALIITLLVKDIEKLQGILAKVFLMN